MAVPVVFLSSSLKSFIVLTLLLLSSHSFGRAESLSAGIPQFIVGFEEEYLKVVLSLEREKLEDALQPIFPSPRARSLATASMGRLKRKLAGEVVRGSQQHLPLIGAKWVDSRAGSNPNREILAYFSSIGLVKYFEENIVLRTYATTNDPESRKLWGLENNGSDLFSVANVDINASSAWEIRSDTGDVAVAVLDTGFDPALQDLRANSWTNPGEIPANGIDDDQNGYVDDSNGCDLVSYAAAQGSHCGVKPFSDNNHGSHVAGTIGARGNNGIGISGVAQRTQLVSVSFLDSAGSGSLIDMIEGIHYIIRLKQDFKISQGRKGADIRVVNASFGHSGAFSQAEHNAIKALSDEGILLVAAAGNGGFDGIGDDNDSTTSYPANYDLPNVISVAAVGKSGDLASFSNYGRSSVHVAAPGEAILSTVLGGRYQSFSGTSMAAPHVSGVAALLFAHRPQVSSTLVREAIIASVKDGSVVSELTPLANKISSGGMVDAEQALVLIEGDIDSPRITQHPQNFDAVPGETVTLTVGAIGAGTLRYQWQKNNVDLPGSTSASLVISSFSASDVGTYRCVVSSEFGIVRSQSAALSLLEELLGDVNKDLRVDFQDIFIVMTNLGKRGKNTGADLDKDGQVTIADLLIVFDAIKRRL